MGKGGGRGPGGSGVREKGADVGRGSWVLESRGKRKETGWLRSGRRGRREQRGALAYSEWCGKRPAAASRSSPRAANSAPRGPAAGSRSRSWPRTSLAPGPALSWHGRGPSFPRRRPGELRSLERSVSPTGAHPGPEADPLLRGAVGEDCAEAGPRDFRRRGGTSGFVAEVAGAVPWQRFPPGEVREAGVSPRGGSPTRLPRPGPD